MNYKKNIYNFFTAVPLIISLAGVPAVFADGAKGGDAEEGAEGADIVLFNGVIHTVNDNQPRAEAIAVRDGKIVFVGSNKQAKSHVSKDTRTLDLEGLLVLPGFIETHSHVVVGSVLLSGIALSASDSPEQIAEQVKAYALEHPEKPLLFGQGHNFPGQPGAEKRATRQLLDQAVPDGRPVVLFSNDLHASWVNSSAFRNAGIDASTPDPTPAGSYDRDAAGNPSGYIRGGPAHLPVATRNGVTSDEAISASLLPILQTFSELGFTALLDSGAPLGMETGFKIMARLEEQGALPVRVSGAIMAPYIPEPVEKLKKYNELYRSPQLRMSHLKVLGDGVLETHKAALFEPYSDRPGESGALTFGSQEVMDEIILKAAKAGFGVQVHVIGDLGAHAALNSLEKVRAAGLDTRFNLTHAQLISPKDRKRIKPLEAIIQTTPLWFTQNEANMIRLGSKRYQHMYDFKALIDDGVIVASGSDWPVGGLAPVVIDAFNNAETAVTRRYPRRMLVEAGIDPAKPPYNTPLPPADSHWTIEDAIRSYTINGAYLLGMEDQIGSLEVGKYADLVVLDRNVLTAPAEQIHETRVLLTMMNGKVFHDVQFGLEKLELDADAAKQELPDGPMGW